MSMKMITIAQFLATLCTYLFVTVLLPATVAGRRMKGRRLTERFLFYFITGNFYIMNLVFLFQLLHISNRFTLVVGTILPAILMRVKLYKIPVKKNFSSMLRSLVRVLEKKQGLRTTLGNIFGWLIHKGKNLGGLVRSLLKGRQSDWILTGLLSGLILGFYGTIMLEAFGYIASDMPVHNYWINAMGENQIFVAGIYPFGFHTVIYYLHTVFGIDTYVLLRVFALVQTFLIHGMLLLFLKGFCKSKYTPYIAVLLYGVSDLFRYHTYSRYHSALPQEFGMLFILPAAYFLIRFLEQKNPSSSKGYLVGFAMSFSMALTSHFYDAMITGLFCMGIAVGFCFRLFRKVYFRKVLLTGILSVLIAVLPMGIAFASGTPLQGSLFWGMNILTGKTVETDEESLPEQESTEAESGVLPEEEETLGEETKEKTEEEQGVTEQAPQEVQISKTKNIELADKLDAIAGGVAAYVLVLPEGWSVYLPLIFVAMLVPMGFLAWIRREYEYGAVLISVFTYLFFLSLLQAASKLGLPVMMPPDRSSIYMAYSLVLAASLLADSVFLVLPNKWRGKRVMSIASLLIFVSVARILWQEDSIKKMKTVAALQKNESIICITDILEQEEDFTWTICSANDERLMISDHGRHYEIIQLLWAMEGAGSYATLTFPTETVYFFIEKVPLDYMVSYANSGQSVSEQGASQSLPKVNGLTAYQGENRWVVMSRMYYWARAFSRMYPNEMKVYLETEDFICYRLQQNPYRLYNLAIDYGYNVFE